MTKPWTLVAKISVFLHSDLRPPERQLAQLVEGGLMDEVLKYTG